MHQSPVARLQIVRPTQLAALLSVDRSTIWRWVASGRLIPPQVIGPAVRGWRAEYIEEWLAAGGAARPTVGCDLADGRSPEAKGISK